MTYGSPSISWGTAGGENRYRNAYDPVSMFDRGATRLRQPHPLSHGALTHDYHNSEKVSAQRGPGGTGDARSDSRADHEPSLDFGREEVEGKTENPDGSVSITE